MRACTSASRCVVPTYAPRGQNRRQPYKNTMSQADFAHPTGGSVQDLAEEQLGALVLGMRKKFIRLVRLDDLPRIHEDDAVRDLPGKTHLVADHQHGHAFPGELD